MKEIITVKTISVKKDDIFGNLNVVLNYLTNIKNKYKNGEIVTLEEEWEGYEDNYFQIVVRRKETDREEKARLAKEESEWKEAEEKRKRDFAEQKRKAEIQNQIDKLKKQL